MKVLMLPHLSDFADPGSESGIRRVVEAYFKHLPKFGVELVGKDKPYDVLAVHAGCYEGYAPNEPMVSHNHGLYWNADFPCPDWAYKANANVIRCIRHSREVTVPSSWVAETFQRDMHFTPHVVPHGIDWDEWQHSEPTGDYIIGYNKNRIGMDVCDPRFVEELARRTQCRFVNTFATEAAPGNIATTGLISHTEMKKIVCGCSVYVSIVKETGGIGILEAMAAGKPILGFAQGGILDWCQHGINAYLAQPGDIDDLVNGLEYCITHQEIMGENSRELAKQFTWEKAAGKVAEVYKLAAISEPLTAAIVIPSFNYGELVSGAIESAINQTYAGLIDIIVVDDGSDDDGETERVVRELAERDNRVRYIRQSNAGVAHARNHGISKTNAKFISCLDADDSMEPAFLETLVPHLEADNSLGLVYSGLKVLVPRDGQILELNSNWPTECDFDKQIIGENQVPTCCVFRRKAWERLGGYRQRYAPRGAGTEDAELWLRIGASGWGIKQATKEPLFRYLLGGNTTGDRSYEEVNWLEWHPFTSDKWHPFASIATPKKHSHEVSQYDEPVVSVVIPVGPGHEKDVVDALDSLEAQTLRQWEAIVVDDSGSDKLDLTGFPFARLVVTEGRMGAGFSRNRGAELARGRYLLFLDADDWLYPSALWTMLEVQAAESGDGQEVAVYGDHDGLVVIGEEYARKMQSERRLLQYRPEDGHALVHFYNPDYECSRAVRQPATGSQFYIWCYISTLIPTSWHFEIGGFDEQMESWEDWDYWIRQAQAGKCFVHVRESFLVYRFYTGNRRWAAHPEHEEGLQLAHSLVQYMQDKYQENGAGESSVCRGCGQKGRSSSVHDYASRIATSSQRAPTGTPANDSDFLLAEYQGQPPGNRGNQSVVGMTVFSTPIAGFNMRPEGTGYRIDYGYLAAGDESLVHREDIKLTPNLFRPVELERQNIQSALPKRQAQPTPPPPPAPVVARPVEPKQPPRPTGPPPIPKPVTQILSEAIEPHIEQQPNEQDVVATEQEPITQEEAVASLYTHVLNTSELRNLPGISAGIAEQMEQQGIQSYQDILDLGIEGLALYRGVGETRAQIIIDAINGLVANAG